MFAAVPVHFPPRKPKDNADELSAEAAAMADCHGITIDAACEAVGLPVDRFIANSGLRVEYIPTPEGIAREARKIRKGWTDSERDRRDSRHHAGRLTWEVPIVPQAFPATSE